MWLRFLTITDGVNILHQYNHSEVSVGEKRVRVDGLVPKLKRVYQFHGCYWHSHFCHLNKKTLSINKGLNLMIECGANTIKTTMYLQWIEYEVVEEYECNWKKKTKNNKGAVKTHYLWHKPKPDTKVQHSENEIIEGAKKGVIFGLINVDIETPDHLKHYFSEMTPY